jgi:uncharacterized protein involved in exopolysaccharide biosynthesis
MNIRDISEYIKIARKWWWAIALLFGATVGTMLAIVLVSETVYEATVTVQVSAPPPQEVPLYSTFGRQALQDEIAQTQSGFSDLLLEGDVAWRVLDVLPDTSMEGSELRERIAVDIPEDSQLMRISVKASEPDAAALLANAVVETGLERYGQLQAQPTVNTRKFIERELEAAQKELLAAEAALTQFQIANKIGSLSGVINQQYDLINTLQAQRDLARAEGNEAKMQAIEPIILEREVELQNLIGLSTEYSALVDRVDRTRTTYNFLLDRRTEAQIKENQILELGSIQVITPARRPSRPASALDSRLIVLGGVVSLLAGVLLTFLLEYLQLSGFLRGFRSSAKGAEAVAVSDSAQERAAIG